MLRTNTFTLKPPPNPVGSTFMLTTFPAITWSKSPSCPSQVIRQPSNWSVLPPLSHCSVFSYGSQGAYVALIIKVSFYLLIYQSITCLFIHPFIYYIYSSLLWSSLILRMKLNDPVKIQGWKKENERLMTVLT